MASIVVWFLVIFFALPVWGEEKVWQREWQETLAAAKKEGKVVVGASAHAAVRRDLPAAFTARFGIPVEYIGGRTSAIAARLKLERRARHYTIDVIFAGMGTMVNMFYKGNMLDPLKPMLILPDVVDPSKWKIGRLWFMDPGERYVLRLFNYVGNHFHINTDHVNPNELRSPKDLLNPKWKGKISAFDPTLRGMGSNTAARMYKQFGGEFVKRLYIAQKPVLSNNKRQLGDWLARGTYPISVDLGISEVKRLQQEGFPIVTIKSQPVGDTPGRVTGGNGVVALMNRAPHPNAARVFVNWIASKEGLEVLARAYLSAPTRNDIDESFLNPEEIPQPGLNYFDSYRWDFTLEREKIWRRVVELLKAR